MTLFDPGLQPERTQLAWRRTALSIAVGSIVALRVLPAVLGAPVWYLPGIVGVLFAASLWALSRRRFAAFVGTDAAAPPPRMPGAALLAVLACFVAAAGGVALVAMALVTR